MTILLKRKSNKKKLIIALISLCLIAGGYFVFAYVNKLPPFSDDSSINQGDDRKVNLKRSDAEKKSSQSLKDNPASKTQNPQTDTPTAPTQTSPSGKQEVNVLLTNVGIMNGTVSASGFVTNLSESGGTCEFIFTNGTAKVSKTSETLVNPTSTTCKTVTFSADELNPSGTWQVVIHYSSDDATGVSNTKELTK